ncbi:MAG: hypothetical protein WCS70_01925 [Verrucomicrobiota bacterium]
MKTTAKVIRACENASLIAAKTTSGDITVFEWCGSEPIRLGDVLSGHWTELDSQVVYNETRGQNVNVFIHDYCCELDDVQQRYFSPQLPEPRV